jgi:SulP family sulfate permease
VKAVTKKQDEETGGISRYLPIVQWLPQYNWSWLKIDIIAGLSVWALMVPASMGYASISGVPVEYGLYAAAFGLIGFALFTTSRQVTTGPSSSTAAVLGAAVLSVAAAGSDEAIAMAAAIVLVAGLLFVLLFLLKLGWISDFLSKSVLTGFTFGIAIDVAVGELFKITGTESSGSNAWQELWNWIMALPETNPATLVVGIAALVLVFGFKLFVPKVPGALVAVALGILATAVFNLGDLGVALVDEVPRGLPNFALPDLSFILDNLAMILGAAVGLLLIGFSVTTAAVREYADKHNYRIDINQELLAQGMSNISSGLVQGVFVNGSLSKSPINDDAGAKSQLSNLAQAAFIILTLLILAPLFSLLPEAVLGAIIIEAVVMGMMDVGEMKGIYKVMPVEFWIAMLALLGVVTFGILPGVVIGVLLSIIWLVAVTSRPYIPELGRKPGADAFYDVQQHPDCVTYPGLRILRFDGGLIFVNTQALGDRFRNIRITSDPPVTGVVLSMEGVNFIDVEGAELLNDLAKYGNANDIDFRLARVKPQVMDLLKKEGVYDLIGSERFHTDITEAVEAYLLTHPIDTQDAAHAPGQEDAPVHPTP